MNELIELKDGNYELSENALNLFISYERQIKQIKEQEDEMKQTLKKIMEEKGIKGFKNENITISYIDEFDTVRLDSKKIKELYPEIYEECCKLSHTSSSVKITLK